MYNYAVPAVFLLPLPVDNLYPSKLEPIYILEMASLKVKGQFLYFPHSLV